ncbi:MAG: membrane-bound O-acyltransferase family protein [Chloroflexi bacterium]|nr:MAG: membrane-bound O-acyltransferase family protein [Chloroflexota bacterium]
MLFNSYTFLIFLAVVLPVSRVLSNWTARKGFLVAVSYLFYAAWNPPFVLLLWFSTVVDWYLARAIYHAAHPGRRKGLLGVSLLINLGLLGYFKYGGFLLDNFTALMHGLGVVYQPPPFSIILPVGISFYTFQTLSYTIDIYRGKFAPWHSFLDYALYVSFFPQLVAGPIVRAHDFLPQCVEPKLGSARQVGWGLSLLVLGLFYKVVIADRIMAEVVEAVYDAAALPNFAEAWTGTLAFAIQIYADFAGYSLCAIGVGLCFGFVLPDNFRFPLAAVGFADFWRRWHITLSTWLGSYLYIPLGGNRKGTLNTYRNLVITMLLGGLWHGASWLFVLWGGLHAFYLVVERLIQGQAWARHRLWQVPPVQFGLALLTFTLGCFTRVFFRAPHLERALTTLKMMLGAGWHMQPGIEIARRDYLMVLALLAAFLLFEWYMRDKSYEWLAAQMPWWARSAIMAVLLFAVVISLPKGDHAFIYFQF